MASFATLCALFYGDHAALHHRLLDSLDAYATHPDLEVRLWFNQVGDATRQWIRDHDRSSWVYQDSEENVPKYLTMRRLFHDPPLDSRWIVWFDDDSWLTEPDWLRINQLFIESQDEEGEDPCYFGFPFFCHYAPGERELVRQSKWYSGRPFERFPTDVPDETKEGVLFAQGGYWWLRTDVMRELDWPDPRLVHNGGDSLLGQAIYQKNLPFHPFAYGAKSNDAPRRGRDDPPIGAVDSNFRR